MSARVPKSAWRLATAEQMRSSDAKASEVFGIPTVVLMENAGRAAADLAQDEYDLQPYGPPTLVLVGPGNNGGDGLVLARTLLARGLPVRAVFLGELEPLERFTEETFLNHLTWQRMAQDLHEISGHRGSQELQRELEPAGLIVDALLGTGLSRRLEEPFAGAVEAANATQAPILSLDLPSGLDADTGEVHGHAIRAHRTATFAALKPGLVRRAGPGLAGIVEVLEIGLPGELLEELPLATTGRF